MNNNNNSNRSKSNNDQDNNENDEAQFANFLFENKSFTNRDPFGEASASPFAVVPNLIENDDATTTSFNSIGDMSFGDFESKKFFLFFVT